jgi:hypothetical protein
MYCLSSGRVLSLEAESADAYLHTSAFILGGERKEPTTDKLSRRNCYFNRKISSTTDALIKVLNINS